MLESVGEVAGFQEQWCRFLDLWDFPTPPCGTGQPANPSSGAPVCKGQFTTQVTGSDQVNGTGEPRGRSRCWAPGTEATGFWFSGLRIWHHKATRLNTYRVVGGPELASHGLGAWSESTEYKCLTSLDAGVLRPAALGSMLHPEWQQRMRAEGLGGVQLLPLSAGQVLMRCES